MIPKKYVTMICVVVCLTVVCVLGLMLAGGSTGLLSAVDMRIAGYYWGNGLGIPQVPIVIG